MGMLNSLRNRLLASYLAVILVTLGMIGLALLIFLRARPLPTDEVVRELAANLIDVRVTGAWEFQTSLSLSDLLENGGSISTRTALVGVSAYLEDQAAARSIRTMIANANGVVYFDSDEAYSLRAQVDDFARSSLSQSHRDHSQSSSQVYQGTFVDPDGSEWVYVGQPINPFLSFFQNALSDFTFSDDTDQDGGQHDSGDDDTSMGGMGMGMDMTMSMMGDNSPSWSNLYVMVAKPAPTPTLKEVFRLFGANYFSPLARAGIVGAVIALILAALITRSVARPLQHMSTAAEQIAQGDFRQRVPVKGPYEVRSLAVAFNGMAQRVASSQQAQRDFMANVSHDLRTPLTSIQGFSQAIAEGVAADPDSAQHAAQIIHDEAGRMHRMVEELLDLARIEAGQVDMLRGEVEVGAVLRAVSDSFSVRAREQNLRLDVTIAPDLPCIAGDSDRLAQVFTNLIDNAIKHTPDGGRVAVCALAEPAHLVVTIADSGEGIPADDLPRIFERFYQVDKSRQRQPHDGAGLGLAITRQIVEAHGGTLDVSSREGIGTVFTVRLRRVSDLRLAGSD